MKTINDFIEKEKRQSYAEILDLPNGVKIVNKRKAKQNIIHVFYKPLSDNQIDYLQNEVNKAQQTNFDFPEWLRSFLKKTNGFNIFYGALSFYGEQTPLIETPNGKMRALIERDNPNWIAPYNMRYSKVTKLDISSKNRWLNLGSYHCDGTQVAYDFKTKKIVAMYALPVTISIKELKQKNEADFEKMIIEEWDDFENFFSRETERLSKVFEEYSSNSETNFAFWKKTLPKCHKDFSY